MKWYFAEHVFPANSNTTYKWQRVKDKYTTSTLVTIEKAKRKHDGVYACSGYYPNRKEFFAISFIYIGSKC